MLRARRENGKAEPLELRSAPVVVRRVAFVRRDYARNAGLADALDDFGIERRDARARINHDYADGGILDRERGLALRLLVERIVRDTAVERNAPGVDEHYLAPKDVDLARHAVARHARLVEYDGDALLRDAVEKRALARVGPAYERYDVHLMLLEEGIIPKTAIA